MEIGLGGLLKIIREEVFGLSIRDFADNLNMHYTTYHNYEKNKFGKTPTKIISEISVGLTSAIYSSINEKSKLKDAVISFFLNNYPGLQDCNYLLSIDLGNKDNILEYIEYSLFLAFVEGCPESDTSFHSQMRYCINKALELTNEEEILIISHIEDYSIHLQTFKDNPSKKFYYLLDGLTHDMEKLLRDAASQRKVHNFCIVNDDYIRYVKYNKLHPFVFVCYQLHHIEKINEKILFLSNIYKNLPKNGYLGIIDPFFDDNDTEHNLFTMRWSMLAEHTEIKKFWTSLKSLDLNSIKYAKEFAQKAKIAELRALKDYMRGTSQYLLSPEFFENELKKIGYDILFFFRTTTYADGIFLLKK